MAHEIESLDGVMLSGQPAWHGLGTVVEDDQSTEDTIRICGLGWQVEKEPCYMSVGGGEFREIPHRHILVRDDLARGDARRVLGGCSDSYSIIQNDEAFAIGDSLAGEGMKWHTAGSLRNGKLVWMLGKLPRQRQVARDKIDTYLLLSTGHDAGRALQIAFTSVRVVCNNTLTFALDGASQSVSVHHGRNKSDQVEEARRVLGLADDYFDEQVAAMTELSKRTVDARFVEAYLKALWPDPETDTKKSRSEKIRTRIAELFNGAQKGGDRSGVAGTAWGLLNAVGEYCDHERGVNFQDASRRAESRMNSIMFGATSDLKQKAFGLLTRRLGMGGEDVVSNEALEAAVVGTN